MELTSEQRAVVESKGTVIVSASAGSGKTFVMIKKLVAAIESGVSLDSVLAVTFTKKAAAQMKEKLRSAIIDGMRSADGAKKRHLKAQLSALPTADISTIHSFCARLLRTYFYALDIDGTFDIISADDAEAREYKQRALSELIENYYETDDGDFKTLLACYRRKRADSYLKGLILTAYEELRINKNYKEILDVADGLYNDAGFDRVCGRLQEEAGKKYLRLADEVKTFSESFYHPRPEYGKILAEMQFTLKNAVDRDIFLPQLPLTAIRKPTDKTDAEKEAGEQFKQFKDGITARYKAIRGDISDRETERQAFFESGNVARAFCKVLKEFDERYTDIKLAENKLDYGDLEHYTCKLLGGRDGENSNFEDIREQIKKKYKLVFVDEYQDVNPVQEEIIKSIGGDSVFLVGDVKQAIYGFRGSKSRFFDDKYKNVKGAGGKALKLSNNFRSSDGVINFVNALFSDIMTDGSGDGINYADDGVMVRGGGYPENYGSAHIHVFGKDEDEEVGSEIYSVRNAGEVRHSREARAVVNIVEKELNSCHYDLKTQREVKTEAGDICILTRKRNASAAAIVRALEDRGYSVAGAQGADICARPEVRQMLDILSYIDNKQQDIPLATALLSPIGGLTCDELASIRIFSKGAGRLPFRDCCANYIRFNRDNTADKLRAFRRKIETLRDFAEVLTAEEVIDKILEDTYLEAEFSRGGGDKLKNVRRLALEGRNLSVSALLAKLKSGYVINAPSSASSDSIKIMTMHASKGLEFPVVIIADVCATFKGRDVNELPLDTEFAFAPKRFDSENMLTGETVLRKLLKEREAREELKNELNLFYVACTRAMCNLHILAEEITPFNPSKAAEATSYAKLFDIAKYPHSEADVTDRKREDEGNVKFSCDSAEKDCDGELYDKINSRFAKRYAAEESVLLPVKSSASAILKMNEEDAVCAKQLFGGEGETGTERGIAYHRFLELCDFAIKDAAGIREEIESFAKNGLISEEQRALLDEAELEEIVNIPVFSSLAGAQLFREQEFLCRLPANEVLPTTATDGVLLQGAIDLLAKTDAGYKIIDYKYSRKNGGQLIKTYSKQLALYKKAVALITGTPPEKIDTVIINIFLKEQINL